MADTPPRANSDNGDKDTKRAKRLGRFLVLTLVFGISAGGGGWYWWINRFLEATDDAFIDGDIVQISPQVAGRVAAVHFTDNQIVKRGELLVEIDPRDFDVQAAAAKANLDSAMAKQQAAQADLDLTRLTTNAAIELARRELGQARQSAAQAQAQVQAALADVNRTEPDVKRYEALYDSHTIAHRQLEVSQADARTASARWRAAQFAELAAQAQVAQAQARLDQANAAPQQIALKVAQLVAAKAQVELAQSAIDMTGLNLAYTKLIAPQDGRIARKSVTAGNLVQKNQILAALVPAAPWVTANFKETQLTHMRPGQPVHIAVDAYPGMAFPGHVDSVQPGTGVAFSLLPPENATGNYVKVVQRVPVKIVFDHPDEIGSRLAIGMSAVPEVDVSRP
ncbi:MAG: HlyD family secretion protein [Alphaproteobacteria bacterium]|nr:HlyD family secretion protein [Alphaproteobacteria bacterium]